MTMHSISATLVVDPATDDSAACILRDGAPILVIESPEIARGLGQALLVLAEMIGQPIPQGTRMVTLADIRRDPSLLESTGEHNRRVLRQ